MGWMIQEKLAGRRNDSNNPKGRVPRALPVGECIGGDMKCRIEAWRRGYPDMVYIGQSIT